MILGKVVERKFGPRGFSIVAEVGPNHVVRASSFGYLDDTNRVPKLIPVPTIGEVIKIILLGQDDHIRRWTLAA